MKLPLPRLHAALTALAVLTAAPSPAPADTVPVQGVVNYETAHVHPIDLTPDGRTLLAVNTAGNRLEIFDVTGGTPVPKASLAVGLEPVSVRVRGNGEAWVVNQLSDSVSLVSLDRLTVTATLRTDNEPADVVFAGSPQHAFVTCSDANAVNVFDPANLGTAAVKVPIAGEEPRALAVSTDGKKIYAAIFESGNGSTVLNGRPSDSVNVVSRSDSPYAGKNPPPNVGNTYVPAINTAAGTPPQVSLIVKKDTAGKWMDDNSRDWSVYVSGSLSTLTKRVAGWDVPDNDVAVIDAATLAVTYQKRLMNVCMAIAVNPATGAVSVVGTDALNEVRWEPNLNGRFLRVNHATFQPGGAATVRDLNPHLDYATPSVPENVRAQSLGDPRGIAWMPDGATAFVTGMGSNNVAVVAANGARLAQFDVGQGPTGVVLHAASNRGYVMNKFSGSISVIDLAGRSELQRVAFDDPTPQVIRDGRPFLYDTRKTSGLGHVSCASCHVDGKTDRLSWDLGDPRGARVSVPNASNSTGTPTGGSVSLSSMKGPMLTQTLQDIMKHPLLHWRGDKDTLHDFSGAFVSLMGAAAAPSSADMTKFGEFLRTLHLPPNPYRALDDSRPKTVTLPNGTTVTSANLTALRGTNSRSNNCLQCHLGGGTRNRAANQELGQAFVAPAFAPFYKRLGFWQTSAGGSTSGFGFFHDGSDTLNRAARTDTAESQVDMLAELMTLEGPTGPLTGNEKRQDTHAGVGRQVTVAGSATAEQTALVNQLVTIANASPHAALVAHARLAGAARAFYLASGTTFQSDRASEQRTLAQLLAAAATDPVTFTLVSQGTERRLSVDRNFDGVLDGDSSPQQPPVLANPGNQSGLTGAPVTLALSATDPNGDALTYSATGLPAGLTLASGTGVISGTPTTAGTFAVTVAVSDGRGGSASAAFTWSVATPNRAPLVTQPAAQTSVRGATASLQVQATDPDGQALTFAATGLPAGLGIHPSTGLVSGTVSAAAAASNSVTVTVGDGALTSTVSFTWATTAPANRAPVVTNPGNPTHVANAAVSLQLQATDPDGQSVTFSATGLPTGLSVSPAGLVTGTPTQPGSYAAVVSATDGALSGSVAFTWTITPANAPLAGLRGEYFSGQTFGTLVTTRTDAQVSFYWPETTAPAAGVPGDGFSVRWTGRIQPQFSETYRFWLNCDDGARLRINGQLVLDHWNPAPNTYFDLQSAPVTLVGGQLYDIVLEFQDFYSDAWIELMWSSPSQAKQVVPASRLFQPATSGSPAPTVALSTAAGTVNGPFTVSLAFSTAVTGLAADDFVLSNATAGDISGAGAGWTAKITPLATGAVTVALKAGAVTDAAGTPSLASDTLSVSHAPQGTAPGLKGEYFAGENFGSLMTTRIDAQADFYWPETTAPAAGVPGDGFSVRWTGRVQPQFSETYRFWLNCDDGARLRINGQLVLDHWNPAPNTYFDLQSAPVTLVGGQLYDIVLEFQDFYSDAWMQLMWSSASQPRQLVPASRLFQPAGNRAPVLVSPGAQTTVQGSAVTLALTASDPDGQSVAFSATGLPPGLSVSAAGVISGNPTAPGTFSVVVTATDGSLSAQQSFAWTVTARAVGLKGEYFAGTNFGTKVLERTDANVNFAWSTASPAAGVPADAFSVRWTGCVIPAFSETYTFSTTADDGVRLWINDKLVIDRWSAVTGGSVVSSGTVTLAAGVPASLRLEYFEATGSATCELRWASPSRPQEIIPSVRLVANEGSMTSPVVITTEEEDAAYTSTIAATRRLALTALPATGRTLRLQPRADGSVTLLFERPTDTGAWTVVEETEDFSTWTESALGRVSAATANGTDAVQVDIPAPFTAGGAPPQRYFRLRVR